MIFFSISQLMSAISLLEEIAQKLLDTVRIGHNDPFESDVDVSAIGH